MKILPFEKYEIRSKKSINELCNAINQNCEPWELFGECEDRKFEIYREINYRNSFLPIAFGEIIKENDQSVIRITLRMNIFVIIFTSLWLSFVLFSAINLSLSKPIETKLALFAMFFFGYLATQIGFWHEVPKLKKLIYQAIIK